MQIESKLEKLIYSLDIATACVSKTTSQRQCTRWSRNGTISIYFLTLSNITHIFIYRNTVDKK